jgi:catechol 2,3-dioxygenase-like lactoylglutathione lyase family enzyme
MDTTAQPYSDGMTDPTVFGKNALEVVVIPIADVDQSVGFYGKLGWRLDADYEAGPKFRIVQFTPPGSPCSIQFGRGVTPAPPGSAYCFLVVTDIDEARKELLAKDIGVSDVFHHIYDHGYEERAEGPDPERRSYRSFAEFDDPDGNRWRLQEITARAPGR